MAEILIATTNTGKLREITSILGDLAISLRTLRDFPNVAIAEETGSTFAANARQKARHYAHVTSMVTLAEDSGFEVDALNGEPGIHSARYLGDSATYEERFADIYRRMRKTGTKNWSARFVCALAVADGGDVVFETTASVEGMLADKAAGQNGFGYDPIFYYPPYGKTFGESSDAEKTAVSHRGRAMRALHRYLAAGLHPTPA
ncbi:MAG TPA: RdgB/HAM1 family non-canonical purine NTP pyrophosphatase [Vicinamibacterales bacterium]|nr:RdgB/HAM1 family non-canonical purine NTP pyrophosphatase [Vicinamibacterales bacterium]